MTPEVVGQAYQHLIKSCPTLGPMIKSTGPCTMTFNPDSFAVLCSSIISQQLSTKAAAAIKTKVLAAIGGKFRPKVFESITDIELRTCGLSNGKVRFIRDLVARVNDGTVPIRKLPVMENDEIRDALLIVNGIGPWTVDMFLMFGLGRTDILPVGDLGIRMAFQKGWQLAAMPTVSEMTTIAMPWQPYRTVASWYLWRSLELKSGTS